MESDPQQTLTEFSLRSLKLSAETFRDDNSVMEHFLLWLILGLSLLVAELLSGAFVLIFFGIGGLITALLAFLFFLAWPLQIVCFALFSTLLLLSFRKRFLKPTTAEERQRALSPDIDATVILSSRLPANSEASISYQGSPWNAVNLENFDLEAGEMVRIERTEGIKLFVRRAPHSPSKITQK